MGALSPTESDGAGGELAAAEADRALARRGRREPDPLPSRHAALLGKLFIAALIPIVLYSLSVVAEKFVQTYRLRQEVVLIREEIQAEKRENLRLQQELAYARSDQAIEDSARRHLNLIRPGDHPVVLSGAPPLPAPTPVPPVRAPESSEPIDAVLEWVSWVLARLGR